MQNNSTITEKIKKTISRITRIEVSELDEDILVREELGVDSLMAMEIVASCEHQFGISIDEGKLFRIETLEEFISMVIALINTK